MSKIDITSIPGKASGTICGCTVKRGDTVLQCRPLIATLTNEYIQSHCEGCFKDSNPILCQGCQMVYFCNEMCKQRVNHEAECKVLSSIEHEGEFPQGFRLDLKAIMHARDLKSLIWTLTGSLEDIEEHRKDNFLARAQMYREILSIGDDMSDDIISSILVKTERNAIATLDGNFQPVGHGIYPAASKINHSCIPNVDFLFEEGHLRVLALKTIVPGDEIVASYLPPLTSDERLERLEDDYGFVCDCKGCEPGSQIKAWIDGMLTGIMCLAPSCQAHPLIVAHKRFATATSGSQSQIEAAMELAREYRSVLSSKSNLMCPPPVCPLPSASQPIQRCCLCGAAPSADALAAMETAEEFAQMHDAELEEEETSQDNFYQVGRHILSTGRGSCELLKDLVVRGVSILHRGVVEGAKEVRILSAKGDMSDEECIASLLVCLPFVFASKIAHQGLTPETVHPLVEFARSLVGQGDDSIDENSVSAAAYALQVVRSVIDRCKLNSNHPLHLGFIDTCLGIGAEKLLEKKSDFKLIEDKDE